MNRCRLRAGEERHEGGAIGLAVDERQAAGGSGPMREHRLTVSTLRDPRPRRSERERRSDRVVPFLRLRGAWLAAAGFQAGQKVRVKATRGRLVLTAEPVGRR